MKDARWAALAATIGIVLTGCATPPTPSTPSPPSRSSGPASPAATAPAPSTGDPATLGVQCTATGTTLASDRVAAQPDGVHFRVASVEPGRAFQIDGIGGENAEGELVWEIPPGPARLWCGPLPDVGDHDWVPVDVVDPLGLYSNVKLACASVALTLDYPGGTRGEVGDPVVIARRHLLGLRPGDVVDAGGYPAARQRKVRVMRAGTPVAVATYASDDRGGWILSGTEVCNGSNVRFGS